ncbi:MAG: phosphoenolpyruvate--protein phosphotransferase, partial [Varibaculum cambriense]
ILACVLIGMGVTSLSMATSAIPSVGSQLGQVTKEQCERAAQEILTAQDSGDARNIARRALGIN